MRLVYSLVSFRLQCFPDNVMSLTKVELEKRLMCSLVIVDISMSIDPDKVLHAVLDCGSDRWYCLAFEMGLSLSEVTNMTSGIPHNAGKLRAVFEGKRHKVGQRDAAAALLKACENISMPIIGVVLDKIALLQ